MVKEEGEDKGEDAANAVAADTDSAARVVANLGYATLNNDRALALSRRSIFIYWFWCGESTRHFDAVFLFIFLLCVFFLASLVSSRSVVGRGLSFTGMSVKRVGAFFG